jgi:purine-binding chemotaxis protein CheW
MNQAGKFLTFLLGTQSYGVRVEAVREINRMTDITPVPRMPAFVAGIMNLRGKIIPVVDLRLKFGMPHAAPTRLTCIVVIEAPQGPVGAIVDSVSDVIDLAPDAIEDASVLGEEPMLDYILGIGKQSDRVIVLVDVARLLSKDNLSSPDSDKQAA